MHFMGKKHTHLLLISAFVLLTNSASAQWWINSEPSLQTTGVVGSTSYTNVVVNSHMSVNVNTTTCPSSIMSGTTTTLDYPFVVNTLSGGAAIVLLDTAADNIRRIIGLSAASGVGMFSGNNEFTGSAIRLNAPGTTSFPGGSVQTISMGSTGAGARAFEHLNWTGSLTSAAGMMRSVFSVDQNGDARVTGKLSMDLLGGDVAMRQIEGKSDNYGIDIFTGNAGGSLGTQIHLGAPGSTATPGLMQCTAYGPSSAGLSYDFLVGLPSIHALQINNNTNTRIGNYGTPTTADRLTVDGNLYLNSMDNADATYRNIYARSVVGGINITSGSQTDGSDGACLTANAWNLPFAYNPGAFFVKAYGEASGNVSQLAYALQNWQPSTTSLHNLFLVKHAGQGIFGHDVSLTNIAGADVFTVKQSLGFWSENDVDLRTIHGNTATGLLTMNSATSHSDGSAVELFGKTNSASPGQLHFVSPLTDGPLAYFYNYDGSALHTNVSITNHGEMTVGHDLNPTSIVTGDVLTVQSRIGMYSPTNGDVNINGNTDHTPSWLSLCSNTASDNGGTIELYNPNSTISGTGWDADRRGMLRYISYADGLSANNYAHIFYSYAGSAFHPHMAVTNGGKVIIGEGIINAQNYVTTNTYDLYVENGILTEQVRVALSTTGDWTDYVFAKDYKLMPLSRVADYVKKNSHLPGVPSAEEVKNEGIDVASMDATLLKKIEELTLYVIQQNARIDELEKKLNKQTSK